MLRFHVPMQGGWDVGTMAGCFLAAGLIALGVPLPLTMLLPLAGTAVTFVMLRRYYRANPGVSVEPVSEPVVHP